MKPGDVVLVDTNVIIEAHEYGCWQSLVGAYTVETVETCVVEAMTGEGQRFDEANLRQSFHRIHEVSEAELVEVAWPRVGRWRTRALGSCSGSGGHLGSLRSRPGEHALRL